MIGLQNENKRDYSCKKFNPEQVRKSAPAQSKNAPLFPFNPPFALI